LTKFVFFCHKFGNRIARQLNKGFKDPYYSLVSTKNLTKTLALGVGVQDLVTSVKNV